MKYVKMLGLAAVAAAALMAFVGASSASASVLCKTNVTNACGDAWHWPSGTTIAATTETGTKAVLKTTGGAVENECDSTITGSTTNTGSSTETVDGNVAIAGLTWTNCKFEPTKTVKGGLLEIHNIAGTSKGTLTASGFEVTTTLFGISCVYKTGNGLDVGTLTEGAPATMDVSTVVTSTTFGCPGTANWIAKYVMESPGPTTTLGVSAS